MAKETGAAIGGLLIIGLLLWAISRAKPVAAAPEVPEKPLSSWELVEMTVPITKQLKKEIPIFPREA